jgi:prepilin-type N-terminal cleavage/methylation domain-containing protein
MPNRALTRRDPQKGKNGFSTNKGFTVIELMITIAVTAIIFSLALPSYRSIMEKRKLTRGAEQVAAFVSSAQLESVKRNQFAAVNFQWNDGDWCLGMTVGDDNSVDCNCSDGTSCTIDGDLKVFRATNQLAKANVLDPLTTRVGPSGDGPSGTIVFDPVRGLTVGAATADLELISPDQKTYALNVQVVPTGRLHICSDPSRAGGRVVPGYKTCN